MQKRGGRRGQITLFIILGVFILFSFSFVFVLVSETSQKQLGQGEKQVISSLLESTAFQQFVDSCVEDALEEGLILLGEQGGNFLPGQYGVRSPPSVVTIDAKKVSSLIATDTLIKPPLYPCSISFLEKEPDYCRFPSNESTWRFGRNNLPLLKGSSINSIQSQLERYVAGYTKECVNFTDPDANLGHLRAYNISKGNPSTRITFGENAVRAVVSFPVTIETTIEPITQLISFSATEHVRFKKLYDAAQDAITKDLTFSDFDLEHDLKRSTFTSKISNRKSFLRFYPLRSEVSYDTRRLAEKDIFSFTDTASKIGNQSYIFRFARENRPPALFYINRFPSLFDLYDVLVIENQTAQINLDAVDPDEDTFFFSIDSPIQGINLQESTLDFNVAASGYYNLTVSSNDHNDADYQIVRVLVDKELKGNFIVDNNYADIANNIVSLEDPIYINLGEQARSLDPYAEYNASLDYFAWSNVLGGVLDSAAGKVTGDCLIIPGFIPCEEVDIDIEKFASEVPDGKKFKNVTEERKGRITIDLSVKYNDFSQDVSGAETIEVKQCLPHRNIDHPYPYPYNNFTRNGNEEPIDPFLADHACCTDEFEIADTSKDCFSNSSFFCRQDREYLLSQRGTTRFCDGIRGNICNGAFSRSINDLDRCGSSSDDSSCSAPEPCSEVKPWGEVALGNNQRLWCYGNVGCESLCESEIVDEDQDGNPLGESADTCGCTPVIDAGKPCKDLTTGNSGFCTLVLGVCSSE